MPAPTPETARLRWSLAMAVVLHLGLIALIAHPRLARVLFELPPEPPEPVPLEVALEPGSETADPVGPPPSKLQMKWQLGSLPVELEPPPMPVPAARPPVRLGFTERLGAALASGRPIRLPRHSAVPGAIYEIELYLPSPEPAPPPARTELARTSPPAAAGANDTTEPAGGVPLASAPEASLPASDGRPDQPLQPAPAADAEPEPVRAEAEPEPLEEAPADDEPPTSESAEADESVAETADAGPTDAPTPPVPEPPPADEAATREDAPPETAAALPPNIEQLLNLIREEPAREPRDETPTEAAPEPTAEAAPSEPETEAAPPPATRPEAQETRRIDPAAIIIADAASDAPEPPPARESPPDHPPQGQRSTPTTSAPPDPAAPPKPRIFEADEFAPRETEEAGDDEATVPGVEPDMLSAPDRGPGAWSMNASEFFSQLTAHLYRVNQAVLDAERPSATRVSLDVRLIMQRDGRVIGARVLRSSGNAQLDRAAEAVVIAASPLPQMSDDMPQDRLELIVPVEVYR